MKKNSCHWTRKNGLAILQIITLLLVLPSVLRAQNTQGCPDLIRSNKCSCYNFDDGTFLDCQDTVIKDIKNVLKVVPSVHSLTIYDLDDNEEALGPHFIPQGNCIKHIHISRTSIKDISDDTFMPLRKCLETLSIVSSKIKFMPQKAFSGMLKLISIDLTSNYIEDIPSYSFYGLPLMKLNLKGNMIHEISETAFSSLDTTLTEVDLSENNLTVFPIVPLAKLRHLRSLRLAWNEMSSFPSVEYSNLVSLKFLDLNSNNFEIISEDCLKFCPSLSILSFHFNLINKIHYRAFYSLVNLKSINLSHNRLKILNPNIFQNSKFLEFIDLSNNHLHHINGLFCNMPFLNEVVLSRNNILDVPTDAFVNSSKINVIRLDKNCISNIHSESFSNLANLTSVSLDYNYINQVPHSVFKTNKNLTKIRLDNNIFSDLSNYTLDSLVRLVEVRLNNNRLKFISKNYFHSSLGVEEVHLDHNEISFIEAGTFINMRRLKYLSLNYNHLVDINDVLPKLYSDLRTLNLDSNVILAVNSFMFRFQHRLYHLSLKFNGLKFVTRNIFINLTELTRLDLSHNLISVIDDYSFQQLNSVRYLDLHHNLLQNISNYTLFGLAELEELNISYNKVTFIYDMAFDTLKKLRSLNLSFNPIKILLKNIFQQGLPISSLYLENCEIQSIENGTFLGLNNLKILSLKNNSIQSSDLLSIDIPGLKHFYLSVNILDYLPLKSFSQLPLLEVLLIEHCNIEHILEGTFSNNKYLTKLNLAQNIISNIPLNLFDFHNSILEFNISNNFLDYVPYNIFNNLSYIETLDLADNLISKIEISSFEKLTRLKYLILRKNEIKVITVINKVLFQDLVSFDISYNRVEYIPSLFFEVFPNIQNVNISNNDIINYNFFTFSKRQDSSLIYMDISKNPLIFSTKLELFEDNVLISFVHELHICSTNMSIIDDSTFEYFKNLQYLFLKYNKIRRLSISPFSQLNNLENLDISYNKLLQLKSSNFRGLTKLRTLCLSYNNIESIEPFADELSNLKLLDLSYNKLQNILNEDLINLKELSVLYLGHNNIKYISVTAFSSLNKVIQIDLQYNKLQSIPLELLNSIETYIQDISIKGNAMLCSCQKNNTWVWIQDHPKIIKPNSVTCIGNDFPREKCNIPTISQLSIDKHKDNSVSVSWFIRNRTAIKSLQILYYGEDPNSEVKSKYLEGTEVSTNISDLKKNTNYVVCVLTLYDEPRVDSTITFDNQTSDVASNSTIIFSQDIAAEILLKSPSSECVSFSTYKKAINVKMRPIKVFNIYALLDRRMGLIVGCSLGCVVFFVMVSVLLYTKIKERKRIAKSDPLWSEMQDYHSMQSKEDILQHSTTASTDNILLGMTKTRNISLDHFKQTSIN